MIEPGPLSDTPRDRTSDLRVVRGKVHLELMVTDPEVVTELEALSPDGPREAFALRALSIGIAALASARGQIDAQKVRLEGDRILSVLEERLTGHRSALDSHLRETLGHYFDPESGRFHERVTRLVAKDGDLARVLGAAVGERDSALMRTLTQQVGPDSPLMKVLDPKATAGLLASMRTSLEQELGTQRERILDQFSLDQPDSALARLVRELESKHGDLTERLEERIDGVVKEFSLDKEDSALGRLVARVNEAQARITKEFSLDEEASALARMRNELLRVLGDQQQVTRRFQEDVLQRLARMEGVEEQVAKSTHHGLAFEQALYAHVERVAQGAADIPTFTGATTGLIPRNMKGDVVVELGPEAIAGGARIVLEAKQEAGYTLDRARKEIEECRKNRGAEVGLFVFSSRHAPEGLTAFQRIGQDVYVVWDATDPSTNVVLDAGLTLAKAICTRTAVEREARDVDLTEMDAAILGVEKLIQRLDQIGKYAETVRKSGERIIDQVRIDKKSAARQIRRLREVLEDLRKL